MKADERERYEVAIAAAQEAGAIARRYFPDTSAAAFARQVEWKKDNSPVTIADREAEDHLRKVLLERFPNDCFLGEESGDSSGTSGYRWIVDPIDGTRSFIRGIPMWATLVGLQRGTELIAGVVHEPSLGNTYRALRGDGAFKNDRLIHVSAVERLEHAMLCTCDLNFFEAAGQVDVCLRLARKVQRQRGYGDYFGFVLVAQGSADVMLDYGVHPWDVGALIPLVLEAGGTFTDWTGAPMFESPFALATNGKLESEVLAVVAASI
ncbi:MAG: inositol monophosphatase family protein [Gemmataceae bacterium]